jgi:hypothetical protein
MMGSLQPPAATAPAVGVLTRTIVRSPVCKFILHARVRHPDLNDVVFVGEDFIHVKQVKRNGDVCHLEHVATKDDFGTRIKAAKTFTVDPNPTQDGDDFIKTELPASQSKRANNTLPPQLVVLTLESDELLFLYLKDDGAGVLQFVHQSCPMPSYDNAIHQTGDHLAIDPFSRAVAIAASEKEVIIYSSKPTEQLHHELGTNLPDWCPVSSQRPLAVAGVIQHLEFLRPPDKDPDHIILLVVVIDQRRTKALWIDWYGNQLRHASIHPAQPIDAPKTVSNLLIPIRDAAFLMITGGEMKLHKDILSGSMRSLSLNPSVPKTDSPGQSSQNPVWASWCRPMRNTSMQDDVFYLIREDGLVLLITITNIDTIHTTHAGNIGCHAGSAFASLGDPSNPDILAAIGDMSNGQVVHMGNWPSPARITERSRVETMEMQASMTLPNWTPSIDMIVSKHSQSHSRSTRMSNSVFVTSGRQPHGAITELRKGFEAITTTYFEIGGLRSTIGAWVLPNVSTGSILILLSTPSSTRLVDLDADPELEVTELDESATTAMALDQRTLTAAILDNGYLVQVCERAICTSANVLANFEDQSRWDTETGDTIVSAAVETSMNCIVVANRCSDHSELLVFRHHVHRDDDASNGPDEGLHSLAPIVLSEEPICLATTVYKGRLIGIISTIEGNIQLFIVDPKTRPVLALGESLQIVEDRQSLCDHLTLLHPSSTNGESSHDLLAVCGLRDGSIVSVRIKTADASIAFGESNIIDFGQETTRLSRHADEPGKAYALSGLSTCVLTWDDATSCSLDFESLWISDKSRPQLSQGPVTAVTMMPSSDHLSTYGVGALANHLVIVSSSEVCFASVEQDTTTVPRQIEVSGTPDRLIYTELQRSFVCASMCTGVRLFASDMRNAPPVERRQVWPVIDFIPADKDNVSFTFDLQPGERVYALAEWRFRQNDKWYSYIMVGGSYTRKNGGLKGRIAFLQPSNRNWEIVDVKEARSTNFDDPVYALALFDTMTYVACTGTKVVVSRFDTEERKWETICAPFKLSHKGTSISVSGSLIYISTANEGLITLRLENLPSKDEDDIYSHRLTLVAQPPRSSQSLSHTILPLNTNTNIALLSTKDRLLLGLTSPSPDTPGPHRTRLIFEAQLPHSLASIRQGSTRPPWRTKPSSGVLTSDLVGLSSDGSMTGIAIIDKPLWRRLFWLQRILEWDETFSPHAPEIPSYGVDGEAYEGRDRGVPIGFGTTADDEIALFADDDISLQNDLHIDGDVLARVLEPGGAGKLTEALENLAEREDRIGEWVGEHLEREKGLVEGIVEEVRVLLGMWM